MENLMTSTKNGKNGKADKSIAAKHAQATAQRKPEPIKPEPVKSQIVEETRVDDGDEEMEKLLSESSPSNATTAEKKDKTWMELSLDRVMRANLGTSINARVVRANFAAIGMSASDADKLAAVLDECNATMTTKMRDFLSRFPKDHDGITPSKSGKVSTDSVLVAGARVRLNEKAAKRFADLFGADDLASLRIASTKGGMAFCETASKTKLMVSVSQIEPVADPGKK